MCPCASALASRSSRLPHVSRPICFSRISFCPLGIVSCQFATPPLPTFSKIFDSKGLTRQACNITDSKSVNSLQRPGWPTLPPTDASNSNRSYYLRTLSVTTGWVSHATPRTFQSEGVNKVYLPLLNKTRRGAVRARTTASQKGVRGLRCL